MIIIVISMIIIIVIIIAIIVLLLLLLLLGRAGGYGGCVAPCSSGGYYSSSSKRASHWFASNSLSIVFSMYCEVINSILIEVGSIYMGIRILSIYDNKLILIDKNLKFSDKNNIYGYE